WDAASGKGVRRTAAPQEQQLVLFALAPDGKTLALGQSDVSRGITPRDCTMIWWDIDTGKEVRRFAAAHAGSIRALAWQPDGKTLTAVAQFIGPTYLRPIVFEASSGKVLSRGDDINVNTRPLVISADGTLLAWSDDPDKVFWGTAQGKVLGRLR